MNGRSHDDIERLVREVQQFEPEVEVSIPLWRGMLPIIIIAWTLLCGAGYYYLAVLG